LLAPATLRAGEPVVFGADGVAMRLFRLDPDTGQATLIGPLDHENVRAIAVDPGSGILYGVDTVTDRLLRVDPRTAALVTIARLRAPHDPFIGSLAFDPSSGTLLGIDYATADVVSIDLESGHMTVRERLAPEIGRRAALAIDAHGTWYLVDTASDLLRRRDAAGGSWTVIGRPEPLGHVTAIAFDSSSGALYGVDSNARLLARLDPADGSARLSPSHGVSFITGLAIGEPAVD
jgi:streptogramin lyase